VKGELLMLYVYGACVRCGCAFEECECAERASLLIKI